MFSLLDILSKKIGGPEQKLVNQEHSMNFRLEPATQNYWWTGAKFGGVCPPNDTFSNPDYGCIILKSDRPKLCETKKKKDIIPWKCSLGYLHLFWFLPFQNVFVFSVCLHLFIKLVSRLGLLCYSSVLLQLFEKFRIFSYVLIYNEY